MARADFVHLRVHSAFSLSEGAIKIPDLAKLCRKQAMPAVAVTDTNNLFGALQFAEAASKAGIQPIMGLQLSVQAGEGDPLSGPMPADPLVLLAQNAEGYENLVKLASRAHLNTKPGEDARVPLSDLEALNQGLLLLTGGADGPLCRVLRGGGQDAAEALLKRLAATFEGRLYVEIQRHGQAEEEACEERLVDLAYALDLPLVATNDVYFAQRDLYEAHDVLLCIAEGSYLSQDDRRRLTPEHYFKSAEEMRELFADLPEAIENTVVIAQRCAYFPTARAPMLPPYETEGGRSEVEELRAQAEEGLKARLETIVFTPEMDAAKREEAAQPYKERLKHELAVIEGMGFPGYFLIVSEFIKWAKSREIPVGPGRGSGAGSLVAWALSITDLDPLRWNLLFERFLNPERVSMPDFDVDFCQDRRDEVIRHVQQKYGHDRVAQIITFGKLQARAVLRDVGRVLQMPYPQVDRICKLVPNNPANPVTLAQAIEDEPQLRQERDSDETVARLIDIALKLEGLYRHASTHAAGVVIGDRGLDELIALYRDPRSDMPVTQFNMKDVEKAGLVKFDFLGLKTLTVLQRAVDLIGERGLKLDLSQIPLDDERTYGMLSRGETVGVFQLESSGMRDVLRRLKPDRFEDIIAVVALYRPGPMDNIPSYIARKHGKEEPDYLHPTLETVLKETFGIMIYQEQVMQAAQELAGYSLGAADLLRRAMGKKIKEEMDAQRASFIEGASARGVPEAQSSAIFDQIAKFAGYGFNKSHAAAYALVAYQTAYLKANYPVEFLAASMTFDMANTDKLNIFRQELARLEIPLLGPDVNRSRADFGVEIAEKGKAGIRYALAAIKNVGQMAMQGLVAEREAGPFKDISDLAVRLDARLVNKRQIEQLACAGAFDSLNRNRRQVYEGADMIVRHAAAAASERQSEQNSLFGGLAEDASARLSLPDVKDWPDMDRLRYEFDAIGFYLSAHPLDSYGKSLDRLRVKPYASLARLVAVEPGRKKVAGIVVSRQERRARTSGNKFAFVQLSDSSGLFEVIVFSETLNKARDLLTPGRPVLLSVDTRLDGEDLRLSCVDVEDLDEAVAQAAAGLRIYLQDSEPLQNLNGILEREGGGRGKISLIFGIDDGAEVEMELPGGFRLSPAARQAIKAVPGLVVHDV